jgi:hypothetical protein
MLVLRSFKDHRSSVWKSGTRATFSAARMQHCDVDGGAAVPGEASGRRQNTDKCCPVVLLGGVGGPLWGIKSGSRREAERLLWVPKAVSVID